MTDITTSRLWPSVGSSAASNGSPGRGNTRPALPKARLVRAARLVMAAALLAYAAHSLLGIGNGGAANRIFEDWLYNGLLAGSAALCLLRAALVREERAAWLVMGVGLAAWSVGVLISTLFPDVADSSFPSLVDLLSLAFYPAAYTALILLVRARVNRFYVSLWLDGLAGALAVAALASALLFPSLLASTGGSGSSVLGDLIYPVADLLLVGFVIWVGALTGWRPGRVLGFVAWALIAGALADGFSLWWAASGHSTDHTALDWLWPASTVLLAYAAWQPSRPTPVIRLSGLRPIVLPVVFAVGALALLLYSYSQPVDEAAFLLAALTLALVIVRMALTFTENQQMVRRSRREALTDMLTGLGNRRLLMKDLGEALQSASTQDPRALLTFDLDGFKRYNDTFGHPAGDALLARLGDHLQAAMRPYGRAYRLGGDEFCALVKVSEPELEPILAVASLALTENGRGFSITTSYGSVMLPAEADDDTIALQICDERLYAHKGSRSRAREAQQTCAVLKAVLHEREPKLDEHLDGVAALAQPIGRRFGFGGDEMDVMLRAAELHDIGKIAVPDDILRKRSSLDDFERALMYQHTVVGERILGAAAALRPVAKVVRSTHEHYDGGGYPDGLEGDAIPLAARIIAVCDAFEVMVNGRPYQPPVDYDTAISELRRCAGTQFDPRVVEAFSQEDRIAGRRQAASSERSRNGAAVRSS